ncbi:lipid-binding SYLF domain-containing protein [Paucibacter oligotrophus]|uniref:Lipid-binding SYLF domain-containing protein n=1 Tax=Roseateles oligotrophus TaxID=1769250 RepID=A0A840LBM6_9BURK|nr:YSC84-related protein [Roseateles oligotrophus]MBB4846004.1 lipid-binding SYLF domain-containing protein [Roseateles oligotrophus]
MLRRNLLLAPLALGLSLALMSGCTTNKGASASPAEQKAEIEKGTDATLATLYGSVKGSQELAGKARAILVFPKVYAAGLGVGGEYGEGALRVAGRTVDYYKTTAVSFGFQAGAQSKALVLMFMTQNALDEFRKSKGWTAGADASVALVKVGANGTIDTNSLDNAVNAFALTNAGLMAAATLNGSKISKIEF